MLNCGDCNAVRVIKKMEEQDNLAGPPRPSIHDPPPAILPGTRTFILSGRINVDSLAPRSSSAQTH
jgi:hypothetical protein